MQKGLNTEIQNNTSSTVNYCLKDTLTTRQTEGAEVNFISIVSMATARRACKRQTIMPPK